MEKIKEIRMTLIILLLGVFCLTGCFFNEKSTITFKTNGGSDIDNISVKNGNKIEEPKKPTKDGYEFEGWYVDGEKYDFDTKVDGDITLVAKWKKIEEKKEEVEEEETTETTTTKKGGKTTTTKASKTTTSKTTKSSTEEGVATTKKTTKKKTTKKTTTVATTTTTVKVVETTTVEATTLPTIATTVAPIVTTTEATTEPTTTKAMFKGNVSLYYSLDENEEKVFDSVEFTFNTEESNIESNISSVDLNSLNESDPKEWTIETNNGTIINLVDAIENNKFALKEEVTSFTVYYNGDNFSFDYDTELKTWFIKYPTVAVGLRYYNNLETAIKLSKEGDTVTLLSDQTVNNVINLDHDLIINGDHYKIISELDYVFNIKDSKKEIELDDGTKDEVDQYAKTITLTNAELNVKSIFNVDEASKVEKIELINLNGVYSNEISTKMNIVSFDNDTFKNLSCTLK